MKYKERSEGEKKKREIDEIGNSIYITSGRQVIKAAATCKKKKKPRNNT